MAVEKKWPQPGDRLVHRFRKREGEVVVEVISVDQATGMVGVRIGEATYPSLSAAATDITGFPTNGWIFWGLKKQTGRPAMGGLR